MPINNPLSVYIFYFLNALQNYYKSKLRRANILVILTVKHLNSEVKNLVGLNT